MTTPRYSFGSKIICFCVQVHVKRRDTYLYFCESSWRQTLVSSLREIFYYLHQPSTWGNQRGGVIYTHQGEFLAPLQGLNGGTSRRAPTIASLRSCCWTRLQDRGVAHYLLSLLFSLVSLPFSFYFCVPNQKYQKYLLPVLC